MLCEKFSALTDSWATPSPEWLVSVLIGATDYCRKQNKKIRHNCNTIVQECTEQCYTFHRKPYLIPISRWISVSLSALMIAPLLTFARQAATYHVGMPTQSSSHATTVGPFHRAKGVPAFIASAKSSCREESSILPNMLGLKYQPCRGWRRLQINVSCQFGVTQRYIER